MAQGFIESTSKGLIATVQKEVGTKICSEDLLVHCDQRIAIYGTLEYVISAKSHFYNQNLKFTERRFPIFCTIVR